MKSLLLAIQFMTILPVKVRGEVDEADMLGSSVWFPLAGLLEGGLLLMAAWGLMHLLGPMPVAALMLALHSLASGGFHLDGLSDTADGLACKGDVTRRLEVMRDGAVGPVGAMALFMGLIIKFAVLYELAATGMAGLGLGLLFMPAISKWAMLVGMRLGRPSRKEGLGRIFIGRVGSAIVIATGLLLLILMTAYVMLAGWSCEPIWHVFSPFAMTAVFIIALLANAISLRAFNGQSGDTLGATGELAESGYLIILAIWSNTFIS